MPFYQAPDKFSRTARNLLVVGLRSYMEMSQESPVVDEEECLSLPDGTCVVALVQSDHCVVHGSTPVILEWRGSRICVDTYLTVRPEHRSLHKVKVSILFWVAGVCKREVTLGVCLSNEEAPFPVGDPKDVRPERELLFLSCAEQDSFMVHRVREFATLAGEVSFYTLEESARDNAFLLPYAMSECTHFTLVWSTHAASSERVAAHIESLMRFGDGVRVSVVAYQHDHPPLPGAFVDFIKEHCASDSHHPEEVKVLECLTLSVVSYRLEELAEISKAQHNEAMQYRGQMESLVKEMNKDFQTMKKDVDSILQQLSCATNQLQRLARLWDAWRDITKDNNEFLVELGSKSDELRKAIEESSTGVKKLIMQSLEDKMLPIPTGIREVRNSGDTLMKENMKDSLYNWVVVKYACCHTGRLIGYVVCRDLKTWVKFTLLGLKFMAKLVVNAIAAGAAVSVAGGVPPLATVGFDLVDTAVAGYEIVSHGGPGTSTIAASSSAGVSTRTMASNDFDLQMSSLARIPSSLWHITTADRDSLLGMLRKARTRTGESFDFFEKTEYCSDCGRFVLAEASSACPVKAKVEEQKKSVHGYTHRDYAIPSSGGGRHALCGGGECAKGIHAGPDAESSGSLLSFRVLCGAPHVPPGVRGRDIVR
eukprot:TRINITY_DN746_c0_g1_i4.p1 TRINITY_DN746_c0_g1~~TRINITY_DN746_c0_g1_i4.p1  ORF type:complete len:651 (-),score=81.60 TRINITY_DN746_c0_g1_i4:427-2379(-)